MKLLAIAAAAVALVLAVTPGASSRTGVPGFRHVVVIMFENHNYDQIIGSPDAPTFNALANRYALLTQSYAITHPSLPNYLALVSGSTQRITSDCTDCIVRARSLADTLEASRKTWKAYAEGIPYPGYTGAGSGTYVKKHVPFLYFQNIASSAKRRARVVSLQTFSRDLAAGKLPTLSFVAPNLCHSMHDCSVAQGDAWLKSFVTPLLASPEMKRSVVLVTFDEGLTDLQGGGHVPTLVLGPLVRPGARLNRPADTFTLLRMIEDGLHLPLRSHSKLERPVTGIWK